MFLDLQLDSAYSFFLTAFVILFASWGIFFTLAIVYALLTKFLGFFRLKASEKPPLFKASVFLSLLLPSLVSFFGIAGLIFYYVQTANVIDSHSYNNVYNALPAEGKAIIDECSVNYPNNSYLFLECASEKADAYNKALVNGQNKANTDSIPANTPAKTTDDLSSKNDSPKSVADKPTVSVMPASLSTEPSNAETQLDKANANGSIDKLTPKADKMKTEADSNAIPVMKTPALPEIEPMTPADKNDGASLKDSALLQPVSFDGFVTTGKKTLLM